MELWECCGPGRKASWDRQIDGQTKKMADNPFTQHPHEVGETYGEHFAQAGRSGLRLVGGGIACLVHAVFPFLFVHTASDTVRDMNRGIIKRVDAPNWERHPII